MGAGRPTWPLVGRDEELALLEEVARTGPVVVAGPPGVGKSRLVADWLAEQDGATTAVRATRSSATVPFGAFAAFAPPGSATDRDRLSTLCGIADHLLARPTATLVVDDAHLLDDGSAAVVNHLVRHAPLRVVVTLRTGQPCPDPISALWMDGVGTRIDLRPLSEPECAELATLRLGARLHASARRRLWALSAGNPLYLREVIEAALELGHLTATDDGWRLGEGAMGTPRLSDLVGERLGRVPDADRRALELLALGEPLALPVLEEAVPGEVVARLDESGLLDMSSRQGTDRVTLVHPLYAEVLRATTPPLRAKRHQRDLAVAALAHGLERHEPLRVAVWLLEGGVAAGGVDLLVAASTRAMQLQEHELAARLAQAARDAGGGTVAFVAHARVLGLQGRFAELDATLDQAAAMAATPAEEAEVVEMRAVRLFWRTRGGSAPARVIDDALLALPTDVGAVVAATGAALAVLTLDLGRARTLAGRSGAGARRGGHSPLAGETAGLLAASMQGATAPPLERFATVAGPALDVLTVDPMPSALLSMAYELAMLLAGRSEEAAALLEDVVAGEVGAERVHLAHPLQLLAHLELAQGRVRTAAARARQAVELIGAHPYLFGRAVAAGATAAAAAAQAGDVDGAEASARRARARFDAWIPDVAAPLDLAEAWLAAARGGLTDAQDRAVAVADRMAAAGAHGLEVLALLDATRLGAAAQTADRLARLAGLLDEPVAVGAATLARGLAGCDGPTLDEAADLFAEIGALLVAAEASAQAALAHAAQGLRRPEAASRRRAHELHGACEGAVTPLLAGLDPDPVAEDLTRREREIALMAAVGQTNREIAQALGVSPRTVNSHLNHAYVKLGTSDRAELSRLLRPTR